MFQHCSYTRDARPLLPLTGTVDVNFGYVSDESAGGVFMHTRILRAAGQVSLIPRGSLDGVNYFDLPTTLWQIGLSPPIGQTVDRQIRLDGAVPPYLQLRFIPGLGFAGDVSADLRSSAPIYPQ